jgi:cell wall-associated NlpC family hydrolase
MRKLFPMILVPVLVLLALFARAQDVRSGDGAVGIVCVPLANVHAEPAPKAKLVTQVLLGDEVQILEKRDYRLRISIPAQGSREGWIHQEAVLVPKDKGHSYLSQERKRIVIAVPKTPALILDGMGNHVTSLYAGTRLPVLEQNADGYTVQFPDHTSARIAPSDAVIVDRNVPPLNTPSPAEIARTARKFQGIRYLSGGMTDQGMDAPGLIYIVYRILGIDLDMDLAALREKSITVSKKDLQPGDIVLFHGEGPGLYLTDGRFLHGAGKGRLQLGGIHDRRYARAFSIGLRVLGAGQYRTKRPAEMMPDEIMIAQTRVADLPLGRRIAWWAERFVGTPYDADPLGLYVRTNHIVADEKADCMYLTFRAVELARSSTPGEAIEQALDLRFRTHGVLRDGLVTNYGDRFQYGEDMVYSGKWGRNITDELGRTTTAKGSRGHDRVNILPKTTLATAAFQKKLQDGDIIFWVKDPSKRVVDEIVAHLSFVRVKDGRPYLVHASGVKDNGVRPGHGEVKEVPFDEYLRGTKFVGAFVTRYGQ